MFPNSKYYKEYFEYCDGNEMEAAKGVRLEEWKASLSGSPSDIEKKFKAVDAEIRKLKNHS